MWERLLKWDRDTFIYLNGLGIEQYDVFWSTVTQFTTWIPLFLLFIALFFLKFPKKEAWYRFLMVLCLIMLPFTSLIFNYYR